MWAFKLAFAEGSCPSEPKVRVRFLIPELFTINWPTPVLPNTLLTAEWPSCGGLIGPSAPKLKNTDFQFLDHPDFKNV